MLKEMVRVQWKRQRAVVIVIAVVLFSVPLLIVHSGPPSDLSEVGWWLRAAEAIGRLIPLVALFYGAGLGLAAWADDMKGQHVYALSLPVSRERYVLYRFIAQGTGVVVPALGLLAGALVATASVQLPAGVHAYPFALAGRTFLAILVCYAVFFTIAISLRKTMAVLLIAILIIVSFDLVTSILELDVSAMETVADLLIKWPGPLAILTGRWALFDV